MMLLDIIVLRSKGPLTFSQTKWNTHFQENQSVQTIKQNTQRTVADKQC